LKPPVLEAARIEMGGELECTAYVFLLPSCD
jgi:hypothetical protein